MLQMYILYFALMLVASSTHALIGYDCGTQALNITTLSLLDVAPCEIPDNTVQETQQYIQLLQINQFKETRIIQCKIEVHRTVYHCGMWSHVSVVRYGENEYVREIARENCLKLYNSGFLTATNNHVISGIRVNNTVVHSVTLAGELKDDGECEGASYSDPYGSWTDVVVQGTLKITVQDYRARVNVDTNKIYLRSGVTCILSDTFCIDSEGGYTFWEAVPVDTCRFDQYGVLYEGLANKITDSEFSNKQTVYSLSSEDVTFALAAVSKTTICGYTLIRTEHPKLVIFETTKGDSFAAKSDKTVDNLDIFTYVNSKFVYVEKHIKTQMQRLYREVLLQRCELERQTLMNTLAIASQAPDAFAYNLMRGPGYMAVTSGEVVHVIKCTPVEVAVEHLSTCYAELPVTRRNNTYFLTPKTHILKTIGNRINCNRVLPAYYQVDNGWLKFLPDVTRAEKPMSIKPMTKPTWEYENPPFLATSGIYSPEDIRQLRDRIMFPVEKPALLNDIAREMRGHPIDNRDGTLSYLLNEETLEKIVQSSWTKIWNKLITFGTASAAFIAIFVIIQIIKSTIEILINGFVLHRAYGWSVHLLAAVWGSITHLLVQLANDADDPTAPTPTPPTTVYEMQELNRDERKESQLPETAPRSSAPLYNLKDAPNYFNLRG